MSPTAFPICTSPSFHSENLRDALPHQRGSHTIRPPLASPSHQPFHLSLGKGSWCWLQDIHLPQPAAGIDSSLHLTINLMFFQVQKSEILHLKFWQVDLQASRLEKSHYLTLQGMLRHWGSLHSNPAWSQLSDLNIGHLQTPRNP